MPTSLDYEQFQRAVAPAWARKANGENLWSNLGKKKDETVAIAKQAVLARYPSVCPATALDAIGADRGLPRYVSDTDDTHRERVVGAWDVWKWAGTPKGILNELWRAFQTTNVWLITQQGRQWRQLSSSLDDISFYDSSPRSFGTGTFWNSFQVWFTDPLPWGSPPSDTSQEAETCRDIIRRWKPGHARCARIVLVEYGPVWGYPMAQWGDYNYGDPASVSYWTPPT